MSEELLLEVIKEKQMYLEKLKDISDELTMAKKLNEIMITELQQYRALGTITELKILKEKERTKKPKSNKIIFTRDSYAYCPYCKENIDVFFFAGKCKNCGKEIEWG